MQRRVIARIETPVGSGERGRSIAPCTLTRSLAEVWPRLFAFYDWSTKARVLALDRARR